MPLWRDVASHNHVSKFRLAKRAPVPISALVVLASFFIGIVDARASQAQESIARTVVVEEYRVGEIKVTGAKALPNERIKDALGLVSGQFLAPSQILRGLDVIKTGYGRLGFINCKVTHILEFDEPRKTVNLTLYIDEGQAFYLNRITITGNTRTPDEAIRGSVLI